MTGTKAQLTSIMRASWFVPVCLVLSALLIAATFERLTGSSSAASLGTVTATNMTVDANIYPTTMSDLLEVASVQVTNTANLDITTVNPGTTVNGSSPASHFPNWITAQNGTSGTNIMVATGAGRFVHRRVAGSGYGTAMIPWLTHKSVMQGTVDINNLAGANTGIGLIIAANSTGNSGIIARVYYDGTNVQFALGTITAGGAPVNCAGPFSLGTNRATDRTINLQWDPYTQTADASINGNAASAQSCSSLTGSGRYAGAIILVNSTTPQFIMNTTFTWTYA